MIFTTAVSTAVMALDGGYSRDVVERWFKKAVRDNRRTYWRLIIRLYDTSTDQDILRAVVDGLIASDCIFRLGRGTLSAELVERRATLIRTRISRVVARRETSDAYMRGISVR